MKTILNTLGKVFFGSLFFFMLALLASSFFASMVSADVRYRRDTENAQELARLTHEQYSEAQVQVAAAEAALRAEEANLEAVHRSLCVARILQTQLEYRDIAATEIPNRDELLLAKSEYADNVRAECSF
jgi:phage-related minor tail protein